MSKFATAVTLIVVGIVLLVMYQALVVVPNERIEAEARANAAKLQAEENARLQKEIKYNNCTREAYTNYSNNWDGQCELAGKSADCSLLPYQYQHIEKVYAEAQDRCVALYK